MGGQATEQLMEIAMGTVDSGQPRPALDVSSFHSATEGDLVSWHSLNPADFHDLPAPEPSVRGRAAFENGLSQVVSSCWAQTVSTIRCVGTCGLQMGDRSEANRAAVQNILT